MAPGARCAPADREAEKCSDATNHSISRAVRVSQSHHRARAGWRDRIFRRDSHRLIDVERCPISTEKVNHELKKLRAQQYVRNGDYTLRASSEARVFSQTNDAVADSLRDLIVDFIAPNQELLIDAYCGTGFFTKALLDKFERVIGIDWDRFAIQAARENATEKETYIAGDVESELPQIGAVHLKRAPRPGEHDEDGRLRSIALTFEREKTTLIVDP